MSSSSSLSRAATLYRSILRAHKKHLPQEMRLLGDKLIKSEFQSHKTATKPEEVALFFTEWEKYLGQILMTARAQESAAIGSLDDGSSIKDNNGPSSSVFGFGKDLPLDAELSEEQVTQLNKLKEEAAKVSKSD